MINRQLWPKLLRDWGIVAAALGVLVLAYYFMRYIDPASTVDGLAGIYVALQVMIVGFATASLSATVRWLLFYPLKRSEEEQMLRTSDSWVALAATFGDRLTWFVIWYVMFSRAVGQ